MRKDKKSVKLGNSKRSFFEFLPNNIENNQISALNKNTLNNIFIIQKKS